MGKKNRLLIWSGKKNAEGMDFGFEEGEFIILGNLAGLP